MAFKIILPLFTCIILSTAQPVQKLPVLEETPREVLFRDGEIAELKCIVEGGQDIKYSWLKDGKPFTPSGNVERIKHEGSLRFLKPTTENVGAYVCSAVTSHGTATTRQTIFKRAFITAPRVTLQKHKAIEGRPFQLDCTAPDAYPKAVISWKTQDDNSDKIEDYLNRRVTPSPDGTLWFSNVTREDANPKLKYICVAKSSAFTHEVTLAEHYITDLEADTKPNNGDLVPQYVSNDMVAKVGSVTMIWCIYGGTPLAHPDWYKDGKNVNGNPSDRITRYNRTSGRRLLIKETLPEDQGTYRCVANNMRGNPEEHTMKLTVVSPPTFSKKPEKQTLAQPDQEITIPCMASGVPAPTEVTYIFNGQDLKTSERVSLSAQGITLKRAQNSDGGYYGCKVNGQYGFDYVETLLVVA